MNEFRFEYKTISSKSILSEPSYQRPVDFSRVKKIVANFNPNLVNPIKVSARDGKYYVFDGQHTLKSLIARNNGKDLMVACKIYYDMTLQDEALMFANQNGLSRTVESKQKLHSLYVAGDVDVVGFVDTVKALGIACDFKHCHTANRALTCTKKAFDIYLKYGANRLTEILRLILETWEGEGSSLKSEIVGGVNLFIKEYGSEYDRDGFVSRLQKISPLSIIRDGKIYPTGGDKRYARVILQAYNKGLRKKLDDKF